MNYVQLPDMVSLEVFTKRIELCKTCINYTYDKQITKQHICKLCDCIVSAKAQLKASNCPINKWL